MSHPLDLIHSFALLHSYTIDVVRSQYVDSAENAIVFANRRPIVLYGLRDDRRFHDPSLREGPVKGDDAIRHAYRRLAEKHGSRVLAQAAIEPGSEVTIVGEEDREGKGVRLLAGAHHSRRICPLTEFEAESMLNEDKSARGIASNEKAVRMLAHLLVKASKMYGESEIEAFSLKVCVHDNGYKITDARIQTELTPHIKKRLAHNAHDRKSYDYHPSGRQ